MTSSDDFATLWGNSFWSSMIAFRRETHMFPEPGFKEFKTQGRIKDALINVAKIPEAQIRTCAITGLVVDIKGSAAPQPNAEVRCIALRADLDALTMTESNSTLPYRSKNEGVAHMCGHDGHLTALLAVSILLQRRAAQIPSNLVVKLLFQPAEEGTPPGTGGFDYEKTGGGGALPMMWEGCLDGVDEIYGWHNWPAWPLGDLRVKQGAIMAHECEFQIDIHGKGGHGSQPHETIDPIVCGAAVVSALQTIVSRNLPSYSNAVVSVCQFHSGERCNVIPDEAQLSGTIRDVSEADFAIISKRFPALVNGICKGFGCSADTQISSCNPVLMNHQKPTEAVQRCANKLTDSLALRVTQENLPVMGAEDFAHYVKDRPGCYFFLGTSEPTTRGLASYGGAEGTMRSNCICHGTTFDFNDNTLPYATAMLIRIVEDRFGIELYTQTDILEAPISSSNSLEDDAPASKKARTL